MDASTANKIKGRTPLRASHALRTALTQRGKRVGSITYFYSAKNERDVVFSSDLEFAHGLLLEADESVKSYDVDPDRIASIVEGQGYLGSKPDVIVNLWSGTTRYVGVQYLSDQGARRALRQAETQDQAARAVGAEWAWFSEKDVQARERLLHDWMHIAPVLAQSHIDLSARWEPLAAWTLAACRTEITLGALQVHARDPWELVFSAVFRLVHLGMARTDLDQHPLSAATRIRHWSHGHA